MDPAFKINLRKTKNILEKMCPMNNSLTTETSNQLMCDENNSLKLQGFFSWKFKRQTNLGTGGYFDLVSGHVRCSTDKARVRH